jgi:hypothetical protein
VGGGGHSGWWRSSTAVGQCFQLCDWQLCDLLDHVSIDREQRRLRVRSNFYCYSR